MMSAIPASSLLCVQFVESPVVICFPLISLISPDAPDQLLNPARGSFFCSVRTAGIGWLLIRILVVNRDAQAQLRSACRGAS